jgi:hypothetical protein
MTELILFHHAQGLTEGVRGFADELRAAGHVVHVPDLYEGRTSGWIAEGVGHADGHLFAHASLPGYDEGAATLLKQRALAFLAVL